MGFSRKAYRVLEDIVGSEHISSDPVLCEGYRSGPGGYESGSGYERVMTRVPGCVILPRTTEHVQKIVRVCNRYGIPYVPYATGFYGPRSHPQVRNALIIDLKRMNDVEIDEKHLSVTVGPGMVYSPVQEEAMRRGMYTCVGGGGAQVSIIANMLSYGMSPLSHRMGLAQRRILGTELVLPDGDIVRMGSLAAGDDGFWGEGPGPDLRGILRGFTGLGGCLGIVTKMTLKLLPFQPERLVPEGVSPNTGLRLPEKRLKWLNVQIPTKEALVQAMHEIGEAEIAGAVTKVPLFWRAIAKAQSKEEFWEIWSKEGEESVKNFHILRILLIGYTSEEQMAYDEKVLMDIMGPLGGKVRATKPTDESWIKNADSAGMWLLSGSYMSIEYIVDSLSHAVSQGPMLAGVKKRFEKWFTPDYGDSGWFQGSDLGHQGYSEYLVYWDQDEDTTGVDHFYTETIKANIKNKFYSALLGPYQPLFLTGPKFGPNYHEWLLRLKNAFDPHWVCHPPVPLAQDAFVNRADWMKPVKDWESPEQLPVPKWET